MYYFYYFQCNETKLFYGGITKNFIARQAQHQKQLNKNKKPSSKPWLLFQDKIKLSVLWSFNTKKEACDYEKQWIINNYLNPLCLNCSAHNLDYDYTGHLTNCFKSLTKKEYINYCENKGGHKAKIRYALNIHNPLNIKVFNSSTEAFNYTAVPSANISRSCKTAKPENGEGRWLFSDISIEDLKAKFNSLTQTEIKGLNTYPKGFILINKKQESNHKFFILLMSRKNKA